jgi:glutamine synthetase
MTPSYAVAYDPDVAFVAPTIQALKNKGVEFIRITWSDLTNNTRFRLLPIQYFEKLVATGRPGVSITKVGLGLVGSTIPPGFSPTGEYLYVVDFSSLRICPYAPGHASLFGWFQEKKLSPNATSLSVDICPRTILSRLVA